VEPDRIGRSIARRSAEIRATVPQLELSADIDAAAPLALARERACSMTAVLVGACATALAESPWANAAYRDGHFELYSRVNVGVTFHDEDALATPAVLDADRKPLGELHEELERLRARARSGELTPPELAGTTFTASIRLCIVMRRWSPHRRPRRWPPGRFAAFRCCAMARSCRAAS
jgi:pyruvate dehydrogenase E2 component (dihydrolipoamide acetyltransferase)